MGDFSVDLHRAFAVRLGQRPSRRARLRLMLVNSEIHAVACYRFGRVVREYHSRHRLLGACPLLAHRLWDRWVTHIDSAQISPDARIGPGLVIIHQTGVLVGESRIGADCTLHQHVTIGQRLAHGDHAVPTIGDGVWIGPGAILSGGIVVGDRATISAGAVLSKDVPAGCLVAGNPARVIQHDYSDGAGA